MKATRKIIHLALFIITTLIFLFSLLSGVGSGFQGVIDNIPNTLPWLFLYLINIISLYNEMIGGIIVIILTLFLFNFFNVISQNNWSAFLSSFYLFLFWEFCLLLLELKAKKLDGFL